MHWFERWERAGKPPKNNMNIKTIGKMWYTILKQNLIQKQKKYSDTITESTPIPVTSIAAHGRRN